MNSRPLRFGISRPYHDIPPAPNAFVQCAQHLTTLGLALQGQVVKCEIRVNEHVVLSRSYFVTLSIVCSENLSIYRRTGYLYIQLKVIGRDASFFFR